MALLGAGLLSPTGKLQKGEYIYLNGELTLTLLPTMGLGLFTLCVGVASRIKKYVAGS